MAVQPRSDEQGYRVHSSHWGPFEGRWLGEQLDIRPTCSVGETPPLMGNLVDTARHATRVTQPMIRSGWLEAGPGPSIRGRDPFIPVSWDEAVRLVGDEIRRVIELHGNESIYGGSYGWSSAGRFHHAQSHVHRFLNVAGGYVASKGTYSTGAAEVFLPHVVDAVDTVTSLWHDWEAIITGSDLILAFGGIPLKNMLVAPGGVADHCGHENLRRYSANGGTVVSVSPVRDDVPTDLPCEWIPMRAFGDTALLLALSYVLINEGLHDERFLDRYTVGFPRFADYVLGKTDGIPKTPSWAEGICGVAASDVVLLARRAASSRTLVNTTYSLQRSQFGEQPLWAALSFAALLGQVGLPGRGFSYGLGSMGSHGKLPMAFPIPALPQGKNRVATFIPVARVADMLLRPGQDYDFDGHVLTYPDIHLVYWAGGNPFHHHQDLFRLREAFARPDTVVVHEQYWTATARHADVVLPVTLSMERSDLGAGRQDTRLIAMHQLVPPLAGTRDDFDIFADLAAHLGVREEYTEGRSSHQWLDVMVAQVQQSMSSVGLNPPDRDEFWRVGGLDIPTRPRGETPIEAFRRNPDRHPLPTPSGRIELFSEVIASFGYDDCPGHATWLEPSERVTVSEQQQGFLQLVANNPATRLHSQLDPGRTSRHSKVSGREPLRIAARDAAVRGIADGDLVRVWNDRGQLLAGAVVTNDVVDGAVQLSTGAWFEPADLDGRPTCIHGNPNSVTLDAGTSRLSQGCSGQLARVRVEKFLGEAPDVTVTKHAPHSD
ncbi:molybdopterin-dependent oxidoreductase [Nocardioides pocheonensis]|uniref:Molybdopterin oxidoreductase n=1 Tax=Nocardioides pocheonensis TaxID=661485 RepID=A0A3N0GIG2_9ACTN|nr:molybdopterin-dependent oxidoreductase [Nocardioides pocheonensis]RNM12221.1 hypothetical protein EFL26_20700 [Nocardioides pocheonensis]